MTGIERLRDVACNKTVRLTALLRDIADQIERETLPRPRFEDGELVRCGDMAMFGNKPREVVEYEVNDCGVAILHTYGDCWSLLHGQRLKRPEPPKVLDADGVEIKVGDEVWFSGSGCGPCRVSSVLENKMVTVEFEHVSCTDLGVEFTHRRPEPPDTWERLTADIERCGDSCAYFGRNCADGGSACKGCPCHGADDDCMVIVMRDVLGRAKKLAGVEE